MEPLFAPWRHAWVTSSEAHGGDDSTGGGPSGPRCLFCRVWGEAPERDPENLVVWRGRLAFVLLNRYPYNGGHLLIAPVEHHGSLSGLSVQARSEMMELAARAVDVLGAVYRPEGYNLGINQGRAAGAGIPDHVHLHVVPRWPGDTNFMTAVGETRVISTELSATREALAAGFR